MMVLAGGRGWAVICKQVAHSKATGFISQHPNLLPSCRENPPSNSAVCECKPSHQLGPAAVTHKHQRPCWRVREDLSGVCPSNPRGKWNIVAYCFRQLEFQVTTPARHPTASDRELCLPRLWSDSSSVPSIWKLQLPVPVAFNASCRWHGYSCCWWGNRAVLVQQVGRARSPTAALLPAPLLTEHFHTDARQGEKHSETQRCALTNFSSRVTQAHLPC